MSSTTTCNPPKEGTKQHAFLMRLEGKGAEVSELMEVMTWQRHTVRAALTGLRKRGILVERIEGKADAAAV